MRKGGSINMIRRKVRVRCAGNAVPASIKLDISGLDVGQKLAHSQLPLPAGVTLVARDPSLPVVKIMGRGRGRRGEDDGAEEEGAAAGAPAAAGGAAAAKPAAAAGGAAAAKPAAAGGAAAAKPAAAKPAAK
jgi:large subunit ribosomal protein L25